MNAGARASRIPTTGAPAVGPTSRLPPPAKPTGPAAAAAAMRASGRPIVADTPRTPAPEVGARHRLLDPSPWGATMTCRPCKWRLLHLFCSFYFSCRCVRASHVRHFDEVQA